MTTPVVIKRKIQIFEHQWWRLALLVFPDQRRAGNADPLLCQHPVGNCTIAAFLTERNTGNGDTAVGISPQV